MTQFQESFDTNTWEGRQRAIRAVGDADLAAGKVIDRKTLYKIALNLAETFDRVGQNGFINERILESLKDVSGDAQYVEAFETLKFMLANGKRLPEAMNFRPAVFTAELVAAVDAGEKDFGNFSTHLLNFIKYRELLGRLDELFEKKDFKGLRNWVGEKS